jgi:thiamine pyrophosphate-dependent acetolactate synthase large subunit-like protein
MGVPDGLFISSLGTATSALRAASGDAPHLYLGGSMGSALATALGVAEKRPLRRVVAILGDGEALMGASTFWCLAGLSPRNVLVAILADGQYSITGGQPLGVPAVFAPVARSLGLSTGVVRSEAEISEQLRGLSWPALLEVQYEAAEWPGPSAFVDPPVVRSRFEIAASALP